MFYFQSLPCDDIMFSVHPAYDGQHDEVRDEEGASAVFETQIGETPNIAESNGVAKTGEQEVELPSPVSSLGVLILLELELVPGLALLLQHLMKYEQWVGWFLNRFSGSP